MAQSAPWGKPWQSHLPAHASTRRRRRRRRAADTVSQPKEHMKHPTAQSQAPETSCTLTLTQIHQVPAVRQQLRSAAPAEPAEPQALQVNSAAQRRAEQPSLAISGQREADVPLPKSPWVSTDEEAPRVPHRSIRTTTCFNKCHWARTSLLLQENILTAHTGEHFVKLPVDAASITNVITKTCDGKNFILKKTVVQIN